MDLTLSTTDIVLLIAIGIGAFWYLFKDALFPDKTPSAKAASTAKMPDAGDTLSAGGRDFVAKMKANKKRICIFYGSQTGTAEDYATRIAKEAKAKFGVSSLVCDCDDYDFETLDQVPEDNVIIFCMATYGEGEPTDNAVALMDYLKDDSLAFSNGSTDLSNLRYVIFALGNKTYEQFCAVGRVLDDKLSGFGAKRIGERGEGDDDKSMEEDYLAWKDDMWQALAQELGLEEGAGADEPDFEIKQLQEGAYEEQKVFQGELSQRMLNASRGVFDAKNPYPAILSGSRELFLGGDRNCIHAELDIKDTGIRYQAGDHVGVWPLNPDVEVERLLKILGIYDKRNTVVDIISLDPALAKVPFPTPTTYDAMFRHYIDISGVVSRQLLGNFAKFAPSDKAREFLERLGSNKEAYHNEVADKSLKLSEVLLMANGEDYLADSLSPSYSPTVWNIPLDRIISTIPRLHPRYYSISSSPKLYPSNIHITAVVLKYTRGPEPDYVYGTATNYLLNLKMVTHNEQDRIEHEGMITRGKVAKSDQRGKGNPKYKLEGPRGKYKRDGQLCVPIHVRRSNFRLPTSPKIPVIMVGPGTGVAPFRGFVQERVALARKAKERDGPDALKDWAPMTLYYGCRKQADDYLYEKEWAEYSAELSDKFNIKVAFSREPGKKKTYVQQLIEQDKEMVKEALVDKKGYLFICGDAKNMAHDVEELIKGLLAEAKGGSKEKEGEAEWKAMKDRNRVLLDVWS